MYDTLEGEKTNDSEVSDNGEMIDKNVKADKLEDALRTIKVEHLRVVATNLKLSSENRELRLKLTAADQKATYDSPCGEEEPDSPKSVHSLAVPWTEPVIKSQTSTHWGIPSRKSCVSRVSQDLNGFAPTSSIISNSLITGHIKRWRSASSVGLKLQPRVAHIKTLALAQGWIKTKVKQKRHGRFANVVDSKWFDTVSSVAIVLNALLLAASTNYAAEKRIVENDDMPVVFHIADYFFTLFFFIELLLRVLVDGPLRFWTCFSDNVCWNYFDTIVVFLNIVETSMFILSAGQGGLNLTALRMLRVLRVARAIRIIKLVGVFKDLRLMVMSILNSFQVLFWALVLLMIVIFIFSIFLTQNVTSFLHADMESSYSHDQNARELDRTFGTLPKTAYTLFASVAGGVSWQVVSDRLFQISLLNGFLFCFYIFFTVFAMLNVITGVFLDTAMRAAQNDKDECITEQMTAKDSAISQMQNIFETVDTDKTGQITESQFAAHLQDPRFHAQLASLGIEATEAEGLFRLLDLDSSGCITIDEFLYGCMRLKGSAKALDIATLLYENKRMVDKWSAFSSKMDHRFHSQASFEKRLDGTLKFIVDAIVVSEQNVDPKNDGDVPKEPSISSAPSKLITRCLNELLFAASYEAPCDVLPDGQLVSIDQIELRDHIQTL